MTTLIIKRNKSGAVTGLCGAKCYKAKSKKCKCICTGINHGVGLIKALELTDKYRRLIFLDRKPGECFIVRLQSRFYWEEDL